MVYRQSAAVLERKAARRERLLLAAFEAVSEAGSPATVEEVARRAGVAVGTVYRYFPSKDDLFRELFRTVSERELHAVAAATADRGPADGVEVFCLRALANPRLARTLLGDSPGGADSASFRRRYAAVLAGQAASPARVADATMLVGAASELLLQTLPARRATQDAITRLRGLARTLLAPTVLE